MGLVPLALRRDPLDVLATLAAERGAFMLDVPDPSRPFTLLGCEPVTELRVSEGAARDALGTIEQFVAETPLVDRALPLPLAGGVIACLGYELGQLIEPPRDGVIAAPDLPLAVLRRYDPLLAYDRSRRQYTLLCADPNAARAPWLEALAAPAPSWDAPLGGPLAAELPAARYRGAVARVLAYLAAGDVYQVNLTQPFTAPLVAPAWALAARLARRHPVPYGAYLDLGDAQIVANSPELFLRRRGRRIETRPIKGTRPRGELAARDAALAAELLADPKERAEHVMIVDLERNDLGRVCETGSVVVERYAAVESLPTVHHLVSTVAGRLRRDVELAALLRATFPGGSITGAPKVRAMEIIRELEPWPRGPYTGAFGFLDPRGDLELGLAIRTAIVSGGRVRYHAGGGIVADSDPDRELAEAWLKTAALRRALGEETDGRVELCSSG
jgi:para-aminobenzoate synthetase component I